MPDDDAYDPACLRVLADLVPPRRPAGFVEDEVDIEAVIALVRRAPDVPADPGDEWPPVQGEPGGVPGGVPEAPGEPREEVG